MASYWDMKVTWFEKLTSDPPTWDSTGVDITGLIRLNEDESISEGNNKRVDTFQFRVSLTDTDSDGFGNKPQAFGNDDLIQVKLSRDGGAYATVMDGKIQSVEYIIEPKQRVAIIKGVNRTQSALRGIITLTVNNQKPPMMVKAILAEINEFNVKAGTGNKINYVYYDEDSSSYKDQDDTASSAANLTIQRQQGDLVSQRAGTSQTEFTAVDSFNVWFDNGYESIRKLSSGEKTSDGNYMFYIDENNSFFWLAKPTTNAGTLTEGTDFLRIKIKQNIDNVTNYFSIHCGVGPLAEGGILTYQFNDDSIARHGLKGRFYDRTELGDQLMKLEKESAQANKPTDASWPFPAAYNYTCSFTAAGSYQVGAATVTKGDAVTVTDNDEYDDAINGQAKRIAESDAKIILDVLGVGRWEATVTVKGTASYNKGELVTLNVKTIGWTGDDVKELRIHNITQNLSKSGWTTDLTLMEDEESISEES